MTPELKAKEIVDKYNKELIDSACWITDYDGAADFEKTKSVANDLAIIHVQGIIECLEKVEESNQAYHHLFSCYDEKEYWQQVLTEIQKP